VLVTGVSGFVGSYLAQDLIEKGAEVYGLVRRRADCTIPKNIAQKKLEHSITFIEAGLEDLTGLAQAVETANPDYVFHLAAQSFVPRSFSHPLETAAINSLGTNNLLEAVRIKNVDPVMVFAGSSEEYGLVISSESQYQEVKEKYGTIFPEPAKIPEIPTKETDPLRPMSPYATSKVYGDFLFRNYYHTYGLKGIVSRAFNHEGAGRGIQFVTSVVTNQVTRLKCGEIQNVRIGNVNAFRDWSHINDILEGYQILAQKGRPGDVYNQGSNRTTSVISYILYSIEACGHEIREICTTNTGKCVKEPLKPDFSPMFGVRFEKTELDRLMLAGEISFGIQDGGITVKTGDSDISVQFDPDRFRPSEVPILFADITKIKELGFTVRHHVKDIVRDQMNYFMDENNRCTLNMNRLS
jgi:GDPmannose 4,6-dehydratase